MSDQRRERIAAAGDVFERVLQGYDAEPATDRLAGRVPGQERVQLAQLRTAAARTVDLYAQLLQDSLEAVVHFAEDVVPGLGAGGEPPLMLAGRSGATLSAPVWIHNSTDALISGVALRLTDLTAPGGALISGALAAFLPDRTDIQPRGSAESQLSLAIPADAAAATYHGHLLASALPASALAVRLEVRA
jgi:hypothetical protein